MPRIPHGAAPVTGGTSGRKYIGYNQIADYGRAAGFRGQGLVTIVAIAIAESAGDIHAVGDISLQTAKWGPSIGLLQVRSLIADYGTGRERDAARLFDPAFNMRAGYKISRGGTTFRPWSMYTNGRYKKWLRAAADAANIALNPDPATRDDSATNPVFGSPAVTSGPIFAPDLPADGGLPLRISGTRLSGELGNLFVGGRLSYSMDESSMLTTSFVDEGYTLADRYWLGVGAVLDFQGVHWQCTDVSVDHQDATPIMTLRSIPSGVRAMKRTTTGSRGAMSPTTFMRAVAKAAGLGFFGEPTPKVQSIVPADKLRGDANDPLKALVPSLVGEKLPATETAWELGQRLAAAAGFKLFESRGVLHFASPEYLYQHLSRHLVSVNGYSSGDQRAIIPVSRPSIRVNATTWTQGKTRTGAAIRVPYANDLQYSVDLPAEVAGRMRVGQSIGFLGAGAYSVGRGRNTLVASVDVDLSDPHAPCTVTTQTNNLFKNAAAHGGPVTADGEDTATGTGDGGLGTSTGGSVSRSGKRAVDFVTLALRQRGDRYIFGAEARLSDSNPDVFDCSELVQWAAYRVGVTIPDGSRYQKAYCYRKGKKISIAQAQRTRGALLFIGNPVHHVAISLGDGKRTIEARGRAYGVNVFSSRNRFDAAALIPGMRY